MSNKNINYKSMQKTSENRFNLNKPLKPKPQWNTNFGDQQKYKLSNLEMIQKKVSLQSKNRQQARAQLAERRRKLQEGIIDQQTTKIYQTALLSKNIDLNPPLRKNLSQMINYEKQFLQQTKRSTSKRKNGDMSVNQELKQTKQFIKKMEKASKAKDITRAVEILQDKYEKQGNKQNNIKIYYDKQQKMTSLQNVEQTVKFLEEKLFKKKNNGNNNAQQLTQINKTNTYQNIDYAYSTEQISKNNNDQVHDEGGSIEFSNALYNNTKHLKYDQSPIQQKKSQKYNQEQDDWLNTIKRMKKMIQTKQKELQTSSEKKYLEYQVDTNSNLKNKKMNSNQIKNNSEINKITAIKQLSFQKQNMIDFQNFEKYPKSKFDQQIEFSLTINNDSLRMDSDRFFQPITKSKPDTQFNNISQVISSQKNKQLIQQMDPQDYEQCHRIDIYKNNFQMNKQSQIQQKKFMNEMLEPKKKKHEVKNEGNSQIQKIRKLLDETKKNLDNIKVETLQIPETGNNKLRNNCISLKKVIR